MSTDTNDIYYVGNRVGVDDVDVLNKNEITKNTYRPFNRRVCNGHLVVS